jgi:hypothetical protein
MLHRVAHLRLRLPIRAPVGRVPLNRRIPLLAVAVLLCVLTGPSAGSEKATGTSPAPNESCRSIESGPWLSLLIGGGAPPALQDRISIDRSGTVWARLKSRRQNGYIGEFRFQLSADRLGQLRKRVQAADVPHLARSYPARPDMYDLQWAELSITDDAGSSRTVRVTGDCVGYPRQLKPLIDLAAMPISSGMLIDLLSEASEHPVRAVALAIRLGDSHPARGEEIAIDLVVKNVGSEPVVLPSLECRTFAYGMFSAYLRHHPLPASEAAIGLDRDEVTFGRLFQRARNASSPLAPDVISDTAHAVRIAPGGEFAVSMRPLLVPSAGEYEVLGMMLIGLAYDRDRLEAVLGKGLIEGETGAPQTFVVSDTGRR